MPLNDPKRVPAGAKLLAGAVLTPTMSGTRLNLSAPAAPGGAAATPAPPAPPIADAPVEVARSWLLDASGQLVLHFEVRNTSQAPVVIGGLGFPVVFNNMIQNFVTNRARTLPQAHEICSFFDPYVGRDGGYLQVTRLSGAGPALVVVPESGTRTPFEAFRPLNDASRRGQTFEGAFEWTTHSAAYAENEWKSANQWNRADLGHARAGTVTRVRTALPRRRCDSTTSSRRSRPMIVRSPSAFPATSCRWISTRSCFFAPGKRKVTRVDVEPAGALTVTPAPATKSGHLQYVVRGTKWGRSRLTV